ncbi:hypothetical protein E2562_010060 [Oryza meyeriana var. granulata]|uniref:Oxidoreductase-like domain-containing protein n=1 Tax=Oryza meyeriana var. granulata TaxID=110450 RepID=A0A6G1EH30_9ORYZ|nr:hypothetical protein E2562_010060 [Oryza meyeriana var. granulata]
MLVAALRVPAPIASSLPAPARPVLRRSSHRLPPTASMADAGATNKPAPAPAPQPPEKPLPGDCCGSGCVRCVWDVYYDELDAYNKALAAHSSSASSDSSSKAATTTSDGAKS